MIILHDTPTVLFHLFRLKCYFQMIEILASHISDCFCMTPCLKMTAIELALPPVLCVSVVQTERQQSTSCYIVHYINISERIRLNLHWIYSNALKIPVCPMILNFCYSLLPVTVLPSIRMARSKIYFLSLFLAPNARYKSSPLPSF